MNLFSAMNRRQPLFCVNYLHKESVGEFLPTAIRLKLLNIMQFPS